MHVATGCTLALLALLRASHEEQQQALLGHHRDALKKGPGHVARLRLALPREGGVEAAIQQWASMAAMLLAVDSGCQAALMAPTQILAEQHFLTFKKWLEPLGLRIALRTGSREENSHADSAGNAVAEATRFSFSTGGEVAPWPRDP
jgi:hypothetical protein